MANKVSKFLSDVKSELKKVSWPTKPELINSTWVVIVFTFLLSVFIGMVDFVLSRILRFLLR
jgi:preprotein translocase subunit SecE